METRTATKFSGHFSRVEAVASPEPMTSRRLALYRQLRPMADALTGLVFADCGHIVPLDRPKLLRPALASFLATPVRGDQ